MQPRLPTAILLFASLSLLPQISAREPSMRTLISFDESATEPRWVAVNDGVMGGRSTGGPRVAAS